MLYRWRNKSWRYRGIAAGLKAGKSMDELIEEFKVSGHTILTIADAERLAAQKETKKGNNGDDVEVIPTKREGEQKGNLTEENRGNRE